MTKPTNYIIIARIQSTNYMQITRLLQNVIVKNLFKGDIIVVYGARQVGKTTLAKSILDKYSDLKTRYLNCDE